MYNSKKQLLEYYNYKNRKINGLCRKWSEAGVPIFECEYLDGVQNGKYKIYYQNGNVKEDGVIINKLKEGVYKTYSEDGYLLTEDNYKAGILDGLRKVYYTVAPKGINIEETYKNAKKIKEIFYTQDGKKDEEINYNENGDYNGAYIKYDSTGKDIIYEATYLNGKMTGKYVEYYTEVDANGKARRKNKKMEANYKDGNIYGKYKEWNEKGKLIVDGIIGDNGFNGKKMSYEEGEINGKTLIQETTYIMENGNTVSTKQRLVDKNGKEVILSKPEAEPAPASEEQAQQEAQVDSSNEGQPASEQNVDNNRSDDLEEEDY